MTLGYLQSVKPWISVCLSVSYSWKDQHRKRWSSKVEVCNNSVGCGMLNKRSRWLLTSTASCIHHPLSIWLEASKKPCYCCWLQIAPPEISKKIVTSNVQMMLGGKKMRPPTCYSNFSANSFFAPIKGESNRVKTRPTHLKVGEEAIVTWGLAASP